MQLQLRLGFSLGACDLLLTRSEEEDHELDVSVDNCCEITFINEQLYLYEFEFTPTPSSNQDGYDSGASSTATNRTISR